MAGMIEWFKRHGALLFIVVLGFSLRLVHLREWLHFEMDEEVIAWKTKQFWAYGKPFLIGGGTPFGLHLGPAFYYLSSIPLRFTHGDPIAWGWLALIVGVITILLCFFVGRLLYNKRVGIIFSLFWSTSFVAAMSDRHWWPLVLDPLFSLLVLVSLFQILYGKKKWWIILGFVLAFAWQADLTILPLFIASGIVIFFRLRKEMRYVGGALLIIALSFAPLLMFELRHPGVNIGKLFSYRFGEKTSVSLSTLFSPFSKTPEVLGRLLISTQADESLVHFYSWCKTEAVARESGALSLIFLFGVGTMVAPLFFFLKNPSGHKVSDALLLLFFCSGIGGFLLFSISGGDLFDFYLASLYPIFLLSSARIAGFLWNQHTILIIIVLFLVVFQNVTSISSSFHSQGLAVKQEAISWVVDNTPGQFAVESLSRCHQYNGIRYLFMLARHEPVMSFMDPTLSWLYDSQPATTYPNTLVVFATPADLTFSQQARYNELLRHMIAHRSFGEFEVLVVHNETHQFSIDF